MSEKFVKAYSLGQIVRKYFRVTHLSEKRLFFILILRESIYYLASIYFKFYSFQLVRVENYNHKQFLKIRSISKQIRQCEIYMLLCGEKCAMKWNERTKQNNRYNVYVFKEEHKKVKQLKLELWTFMFKIMFLSFMNKQVILINLLLITITWPIIISCI